MTDIDQRVTQPVPVIIQNWAPPVKPPYVKNTVVRTVLVTSDGTFDGKNVQISDYEPKRLRMALIVSDNPVELLDSVPSTSPGVASAVTAKPAGALLPVSVTAYEFFGPDAFWINALGAVNSRVTVIKEYC